MQLTSKIQQPSEYGKKAWIATLLFGLWVAFTVTAFWYFQARNLRPFDTTATSNESVFVAETHTLKIQDSLDKLTGNANESNVPTVFNFWDPDCPCTRFNEAHVRDIMNAYQQQGIRFVIVPRYENETDKERTLLLARKTFGANALVTTDDQMTLQQAVPSSPAVAVTDASGRLAYFGPYSVGAFCGPTGGAFVEKTLDSLLLNTNPRTLNTVAFGCFCPWSNKTV